MAEFLADLLQRHGVKNDELLDALKWKYRKIYTEKEMVLRERDRLRAALEKIAAEDFTLTDDGVRLSRRIAGPFAKIALAALAKEAGK